MSMRFRFDPSKADQPDGPTNGKRASNADAAVRVAAHSRGEAESVDEDTVRDLLADLGHLCDREGLDFRRLCAVAKRDWGFER